MAKVFLDANETYIVSSNSEVFGGTGSEKLLISGTPTVTVQSTIERVELAGNLNTYTFAITGNVVTVKSGATTVATITVPDTAAGQTLAFANGSAPLIITGLGVATLGGAAVPATAAAVTATLNAADVSSTSTTTPVTTGQTFTLTASTTGQTIVSTTGNDTITGAASAYDSADQVIDSSTTDNDTYNLSLTASATPIATNVENVNITIATTNGTNPQITASSLTGVSNLTVTGENVIVGGSSIAGDKDVDITALNATKVLKVTAGAGTKDVTVAQASKAGVTVDASVATGAIAVTGAATVNADLATGTVIMTRLNDTTEDAKAVTVNAALSSSVTTADANFTGLVTFNAAKASTITISNATGGAVVNGGTTSTADTAITIGNIDNSGATITTGTGYNDSVTTTLKSIAVKLEGTPATDTATVAAAGYITLQSASDGTGTDQIENISISGNGAAVTYVLTGAPSAITVTGSQSVTITGNESSFDGKSLTDSTTAGTTTVQITTLDDSDLSGIAADVIKVSSNVASKTLTLASGVNLSLASDEGTAFSIIGKTADATINISTADDTSASGAVIDIAVNAFTAASSIKTINLDATVGKFTAASVAMQSATVGTLNITGTKDVTLGTVSTGKSILASALTGVLSLTAAGANTTKAITSGSGNDSITLNQDVKFTVDAGNGDNTVVMTAVADATSVSTGTGSDIITLTDVGANVIVTGSGDDTVTIADVSDSIIVMGDGSADSLVLTAGGARDFSAKANFTFTGVEKITTAASVTSTINATQFASDNAFQLLGASATVDIFKVVNTSTTAGATIDATNVTFASTQNAALYLNGAGAVGGASAGLTDTITGSAKNDMIIATTGADVITGGSGIDTFDLAGLRGATVEGTGTGTSTGVVINLGNSAVTNTAILAATSNYTADSITTVAAGKTAYLFGSSASTNSAVQQTVGGIENIIGTDGNDYIVAGSAGGTITAGTGADYMVANISGADIFAFVAGASGAPSATNFDSIYGLTSGTDKIDFTAGDLTLVAEGTSGVAQATISATGKAAFNAADDTLAEQIVAIEAGMTAATATARETGFWSDGSNTYVFVSDGIAGVGANDVLIKLVGINATTGITLTSGDITAIA